MTGFAETIRVRPKFEHCGRIIRAGNEMVIFIDAVGRFSLPVRMLTVTLLGLGESTVSGPVPGCARLSDSGRGIYLDIGDESYAIPASRVKAVLCGEQRKGPVSRVVP